MSLQKYLVRKKYEIVKLKRTTSNHFEIKVKVNGVKGRFILDTGASNSCMGLSEIEKYKLNPEISEQKAAGAGSTEIETQIAQNNKVKIGGFTLKKVPLVLLDLSHINTALTMQDAKKVQGIIGADLLTKSKAVIDYNKKKLYLLK
ncbi:retroviral-like aspartic protease family protein [Flavobacteriaceae bacterium F08102]|nr:retroviral-like aspartic protease family protein [Flavobacteriaceae bacterium F08102]